MVWPLIQKTICTPSPRKRLKMKTCKVPWARETVNMVYVESTTLRLTSLKHLCLLSGIVLHGSSLNVWALHSPVPVESPCSKAAALQLPCRLVKLPRIALCCSTALQAGTGFQLSVRLSKLWVLGRMRRFQVTLGQGQKTGWDSPSNRLARVSTLSLRLNPIPTLSLTQGRQEELLSSVLVPWSEKGLPSAAIPPVSSKTQGKTPYWIQVCSHAGKARS